MDPSLTHGTTPVASTSVAAINSSHKTPPPPETPNAGGLLTSTPARNTSNNILPQRATQPFVRKRAAEDMRGQWIPKGLDGFFHDFVPGPNLPPGLVEKAKKGYPKSKTSIESSLYPDLVRQPVHSCYYPLLTDMLGGSGVRL